MKIIKDVKIGEKVNSSINGKGIVTNKTERTVTVTFEDGTIIKKTYKNNNALFYENDF